jgi:hypothetical protein
MCLEKNFGGIPGAIPAGHCDHVRSCRLLKKRPIAIFGQAAGRLDMIGRRGFRVVGTPRASSGSVRVGLPLPGENHAPSVYEAHRSPRITLPRRQRAPPGTYEGGPTTVGTTRPQTWLWASGGRR